MLSRLTGTVNKGRRIQDRIRSGSRSGSGSLHSNSNSNSNSNLNLNPIGSRESGKEKAKVQRYLSQATGSSAVTSISNYSFIDCPSHLQLAQYRTMKVYTKTGDKGSSQLYSGERRNKDDVVFEALGATDELNAQVGVSRELVKDIDAELAEELEEVMSRLFDVGSAVATPSDSSSDNKLKRVAFAPEGAQRLEAYIDKMDTELPALKNFILPSGGPAAANLHVARTFARRAERRIVPLVRAEVLDPAVGMYMNRLSDFLFVAARFVSMKQGVPEKIYKKAET